MKPYYHITSNGVKHAIASPVSDDAFQLLLLYFLKKNNKGPILFSDVLTYFNNEKSRAFKIISGMISHQLIDISEPKSSETENIPVHSNVYLTSSCKDYDYILADLNGFPISYSGFNKQQSINISAVAYDYIKASKRSRYENEKNMIETPLSIKTTWNNIDIIIYLLSMNDLSCLLISKSSDFINTNEFINLASYLCNRYNYE